MRSLIIEIGHNIFSYFIQDVLIILYVKILGMGLSEFDYFSMA